MATVTTQTSLEASLEQPMSSPTYLLPPAPPKRFNYGIFLIALHTSLSGLLYGLDTGSIGPITEMPQFRESIGEISDLTQGIYVSSILLFAASASFGNGYLADRFSRRYTICLGGTLAAIGATISSSVSNLPALFVARGIYGIGIGLGWSTTTVYLVEIAPMEQRGLLGCMVQLLVTVGIAAAYFTAYGSVELSGSIAWRIPFIVQASVAVFLAIGMNFVPFSPRWLMQKGREHEALETLRKLRNVEVTDVQGMIAVNKELADIRSDIQLDQRAQKDTSYIEIFHKVNPSTSSLTTANSPTYAPLPLRHGLSTIDRGTPFPCNHADLDRRNPLLRPHHLHPSRLPLQTRLLPRLRNLRHHPRHLHPPRPILRRQSRPSQTPPDRRPRHLDRPLNPWLALRYPRHPPPRRQHWSRVGCPQIHRHHLHLRDCRHVLRDLGYRR